MSIPPISRLRVLFNHPSWMYLIAILFGLLCLFFSQFSLSFHIYDTAISLVWSLFFPVIVSLALGRKASIVSSISGGVLYPFLIWETYGWVNFLSSIIIFSYLYLLGSLSDFRKIQPSNRDFFVRIFWSLMGFLIMLWVSYLLIFPIIFKLNPPFWTQNAVLFVPQTVLLTFAVKNTLIFIYIALFCESALRTSIVRHFFNLDAPYWMDRNDQVFFGSILTALFIWFSIYILDKSLLELNQIQNLNYHTISFMVITLGAGAIGRTAMSYNESYLKTKHNLRTSEEQLNTIISNIPSVIYRCLYNESYKMKMISRQAKKLTGYDASDFIGNYPISLQSIIHPKDLDGVLQSVVQQLKDHNEFEVEYRIISKRNKIKWVSDKGLLKRDNENNLHYIDGVLEDITRRKNDQEEIHKYKSHLEDLVSTRTIKLQKLNKELKDAMAELKTMQSHLVQSEKMASLGVLTAGVAHEINNPLNFIIGGLAGLEKHFEEIEPSEDIKMMLTNISNGAWRASNIVKGLNQFSRSNDVNNEHCDIHAIILNCISMLDFELKEKANIVTEFTDIPYLIIGNVGKLHQVFVNVINNSLQAIDEFGIIKIQTSVFDDHVLICITDTGKGIAPLDLKKVTDPFFTTKDPGKGTGLGLSISYNIIKEHGGVITYQSKLKEGTTASIRLPLIFLDSYHFNHDGK